MDFQQQLVLVLLGLMLLYMAIRDVLTFRAGFRARKENRRQTAALTDLARVIRQRSQETLQVERAKQLQALKLGDCPAEAALSRLSRILSLALARPVQLDSLIQVTDRPIPALVLGGGDGQEYVLTINAQAYLETLARGRSGQASDARRLKDVQPVEITYNARQLVIDEELRQLFQALWSQQSTSPSAELPPVETWFALALPGRNN